MISLEGRTVRIVEESFDNFLCEDVTDQCPSGKYLIVRAEAVDVPIAGESAELQVLELKEKR